MPVNIRRALLVIVLLAASGSWELSSDAQGVTEAERLLQKAILLETVDGNLPAAIDQYKKIVAENGGSRVVAARALLRLAGCYEKLGVAEALKTYQRLINDYSDQTTEVTLAREKLAALEVTPRDASSLPRLRLVWSGTDTDSSGEVSPDGRLLAYVNWDTGDLAVRDLRSGQSRMVTNKGSWQASDDFARSPRWSPDGKRLAYFWYREEGYLYELRTTDLSGKNVRVLRSQPESKGAGLTPVGWYRDGTALLATAPDQSNATGIVRVSMEDAAISPVGKFGSNGASRVCLSPDGRYVAFDGPTSPDSLNMDVFVMPSSGGRALPVVTGPYDDRLLAWTPDGRRILIASNRSGTYDAWLVEVDAGNAAGSPHLLRKNLGLVAPIGFSPGGAFYFEPDMAVHDVMVADRSPQSQKAASAPTPATEHFSGATRLPAWSYDGRKLAYLVDRGHRRPAETRLVRIRDMGTGTERTLLGVNGNVYGLSWSPDGASVALTVKKTPQSPWLCQIVDADSGKTTREFASPRRGEGVLRYLWGPDAGVAYYVAGASDHVSLLRRDLRSGEETSLHTHAAGIPVDVAISPDGKHLAVKVARRILLIPATGGEARELVVEAPGGLGFDALAWSPDGRHVYFGRRVKGVIKLYRVAVTGGAPEDMNLEIGGELRFRPDGRQLAFTRSKGDVIGEIWVMENFLPGAKEATADSASEIKK